MKARIAWAIVAGFATSELAQADTFAGYSCLTDCSAHEAGYEWAEQHGVDDESNCNTPSQSFNEGCAAYVEENAASPPSSAQDDDDDSDADDDE